MVCGGPFSGASAGTHSAEDIANPFGGRCLQPWRRGGIKGARFCRLDHESTVPLVQRSEMRLASPHAAPNVSRQAHVLASRKHQLLEHCWLAVNGILLLLLPQVKLACMCGGRGSEQVPLRSGSGSITCALSFGLS